mgnify:CR=1 FL=1
MWVGLLWRLVAWAVRRPGGRRWRRGRRWRWPERGCWWCWCWCWQDRASAGFREIAGIVVVNQEARVALGRWQEVTAVGSGRAPERGDRTSGVEATVVRCLGRVAGSTCDQLHCTPLHALLWARSSPWPHLRVFMLTS